MKQPFLGLISHVEVLLFEIIRKAEKKRNDRPQKAKEEQMIHHATPTVQ